MPDVGTKSKFRRLVNLHVIKWNFRFYYLKKNDTCECNNLVFGFIESNENNDMSSNYMLECNK